LLILDVYAINGIVKSVNAHTHAAQLITRSELTTSPPTSSTNINDLEVSFYMNTYTQSIYYVTIASLLIKKQVIYQNMNIDI
jgi:hypothetical protein